MTVSGGEAIIWYAIFPAFVLSLLIFVLLAIVLAMLRGATRKSGVRDDN